MTVGFFEAVGRLELSRCCPGNWISHGLGDQSGTCPPDPVGHMPLGGWCLESGEKSVPPCCTTTDKCLSFSRCKWGHVSPTGRFLWDRGAKGALCHVWPAAVASHPQLCLTSIPLRWRETMHICARLKFVSTGPSQLCSFTSVLAFMVLQDILEREDTKGGVWGCSGMGWVWSRGLAQCSQSPRPPGVHLRPNICLHGQWPHEREGAHVQRYA